MPRERIVDEAIRHDAKIIALSALMTTTMQEMKRVVDYAKEQKVSAKIMIGARFKYSVFEVTSYKKISAIV